MRQSSLFSPGAALAVCVALAAAMPARAADISPERLGPMRPQDEARTLRAEWLARGHTVQELAATTPPAITGGKVTASTITVGVPGEYPSLSVSYATDTPGLSVISIEFASPSGQTFYGGSYPTYTYTQSGTEKFAIVAPISLYAQPGRWSIAGATIYDQAGNFTTYTASQLAALFTAKSFTVVNTGPVDADAPRIISGQLLNTTVSLSAALPTLAATITAQDSGGPGIYIAYVTISPPGGGYSFYTILPETRPIGHGAIPADNTFNAYSPTGTWSIVAYGVCDYANNCSGSASDSDIVALFGTDQFTVTQ